MSNRLDNLLYKYWNKFGDMFPTMDFQDESKDDICVRIEKCLAEGKTAEELFDLNYGNKY